MKRQRISDADVRWAIATANKGTFDHDAFTDLLRCRRALRRIERLLVDQGAKPNPQDVRDAYWATVEALGNGKP